MKIVVSILFTVPVWSQIVISEIMYDPPGSDSPNEFVELYNLSKVDTVDLEGWRIGDRHLIDMIEDAGEGRTIPPGGYGLIFEGDYPGGTGLYSDSIPAEAVFMRVDDASIGNGLAAGDTLFLFDAGENIVDSAGWEDVVEEGHSLEKVRLELSNQWYNWQASRHLLGTPGRPNSVRPLEVDGQLLDPGLALEPEILAAGEETTLSGRVTNQGRQPFTARVAVITAGETIGSRILPTLEVLDTLDFTLTLGPFPAGHHSLTVLLEVSGDRDTSDNRGLLTLRVSYPWGSLKINEFLASPDTSQVEFVELVAAWAVDLNGWSLSDSTRVRKYFPPLAAAAGEYLVMAADSSLLEELPRTAGFGVPEPNFPTLNNGSDAIYVYDLTGKVIDSLVYSPAWPLHPARSTEKFHPEFDSNDPRRWGVAVNRRAMTPGEQNSLFLEELPAEGTLVLEPNPFSPDNDGRDDYLNLQYRLPFEQGVLKIQIFDMLGRTIATPCWNLYVAQEGACTWDGKRSNGELARIGIYIVKISARDQSTSRSWEKVKTVVLAKKL